MGMEQEIIKRYNQLESERGTWESHWIEIADRVLPRYSDTMYQSNGQITKGSKRTNKALDSTPALALERFAAAMESMLTPRTQKWHRLTPSDPYLAADHGVSLWFEQATDVLFRQRYAPKANYASQQHEVYMGLGAFGTGIMFVDSHDKGGLRYQATDLRELLFDLNHQGIVDTSYRKFSLTARQMQQRVDVGRWDSLPDSISKSIKDHPDKTFEIIHCVRPREEVNTMRLDAKGKPFASYYIAVEAAHMLGEGGFDVFPYQVSRYVTGPGEKYGRSPAMMVLPSIKVLNEQKKTMLTQGHRAVAPVLLSHDDGIVDTFSMQPGAMNPGGVSAEGRALVHALPVGNLAAGQELMDMERQVINDGFLVSLFQILVETPAMTATEVLERAREKGALLSPTMGRQQSEMLGPMIEREVDVLLKQGLLPPMPDLLIEAKGEFDIQYDSPLSRSQRAEEASGWLRTLEAAIAYANTTQDLAVLDQFDTDVIYKQLAEINAVPPSWMRSPEAVKGLREDRAQQQQQQQMIEAAPAAAGVMKALQ
tara:strand:- start:11166 stop:12779 length:1614 start_codon:yes stop_codon:yes gene_type:complete